MAMAPAALATELAAAGPTVCGHRTKQRIGPQGLGQMWCGRCWHSYERLVRGYQAGTLDGDALYAGLSRLLATFTPPASSDDIRATALDAVADIMETTRAA